MYFDGKTVNVYSKSPNAHARFEAPGNVDQLIRTLRSGHGVSLPGMDFLLSRPYEALIVGVAEAKHNGRGVIDGRRCDHLAFRSFDTDWQLWVETGKAPIPRKLVITSKTVNSAPQYTFRVKTRKTGIVPAANAFSFVPPAGSTRLEPDELLLRDELPPSAPAGGGK